MKSRVAAVLSATVFVVAGCNASDVGNEPVEGDEAITPAAVAAVALQHLPDDPTSVVPRAVDEDDGTASAEVTYGSEEDHDDESVYVSVGRQDDDTDEICDDDGYWDACEEEQVDDGTLIVAWQEEEPEEDPGILLIYMLRDDGDLVIASYSGESIAPDPREQDLGIPVDAMIDVVSDLRLSPTTSAEVVALGEPYVEAQPPPPTTELLTPEAVAAVIVEAIPENLVSIRDVPINNKLAVGAVLRYQKPGDVAETVTATVRPITADDAEGPCQQRRLDGCEPVEGLGGGQQTVQWRFGKQGRPSVVSIIEVRDEASEIVQIDYRTKRALARPLVADRRIKDLDVDLWALIIVDERLALQTTPEAVQLGEELDPELFGE